MAGFYKKMVISTIEDSITDFCGPYCEPEKNQLGFCPTSCIPFCYPICNRPFLNSIPPIPPYVLTKTYHQIQHTRDAPNGDDSHSVFLLFFLSLLTVGLFIFICYASSKFWKSWAESRREAAEEEENENDPPINFLDQEEYEGEVDNPIWHIRTDGLQSSVINSITVFKFKKSGGLIEGTECSVSSVCSVCLSSFQEDETLRLLPKCNHAFHVPCIDTWLKSHKNCPVCRADIVLPPVALPSSSPEQPNSGGDSEEFREQEGAETETDQVGFQGGSGCETESSRKQ